MPQVLKVSPGASSQEDELLTKKVLIRQHLVEADTLRSYAG